MASFIRTATYCPCLELGRCLILPNAQGLAHERQVHGRGDDPRVVREIDLRHWFAERLRVRIREHLVEQLVAVVLPLLGVDRGL